MEWKCPERSIRDHNSQNNIRDSLSIPCYSNSPHPHVSSLTRSRGYNLLCHGIWLHFLLSFVGSWNHFLLLSVFLFLFLDFRESLIDYIGEQDIIGPGTCYCESGEREWWYLWPNMILLSTSQSSCWMVARRERKSLLGIIDLPLGFLYHTQHPSITEQQPRKELSLLQMMCCYVLRYSISLTYSAIHSGQTTWPANPNRGQSQNDRMT